MERQNSCVSCERSVLRRRRHRLTQMFLERYRDYAVLLLQEIMPREVSSNIYNIQVLNIHNL